MAVSALFTAELQRVDPTRSFVLEIDPEYGENEWSVAGYTVTADSDASLEQGASEALYALGYRFYDPNTTVRPAGLPAVGVTLPRLQHLMPFIRVFENYGRGGMNVDEHKIWQILNCIDDRRRPVGHAWGSIINAINDEDSFFTRNPTYTILHGGTGPAAFNLELTGTERAALIARIVQYLAENLNDFDRLNFDPEDGDLYPTDPIVDFCNEVVTELRAINPNAMLGIYAYAAHREPPTNPCPYLYVQVALGFNDLGIGYQEMVRLWGEKAGEIALRGYGDIAAWNGYLLCNSGISRSGFVRSEYPGYIAGGANSLNMETSGNWVKNIVSHYHLIRFCKTGQGTYESVLAEIVDTVFDGDEKVAELFTFWGDKINAFNVFSLEKSMQIVNAMQPGAYQDRFRKYLCICYYHYDLTPEHTLNGAFNADWSENQQAVYWRKLEANLRRAQALGETGHFHGYGYIRRLANANPLRNGRPDLRFNAKPHWQRFPALPTLADYDAAFAAVTALAARPAVLRYDSLDDLVIVDTAPQGQAAVNDGDAVDFVTDGPASFVFSGPGTVTVTSAEPWRADEMFDFGVGLHEFTVDGLVSTSWSSGVMFLSGYPLVRLDPPTHPIPKGGGHRWMYNPKIIEGEARWHSDVRLTVHDSQGRIDVTDAEAKQVGAGVLRVDFINTRGTHYLTDCNPFFSSSAFKMLMPKALAKAEFPAGLQIKIG